MKGKAANFKNNKMQINKILSIAGAIETEKLRKLAGISPGDLNAVLLQMQRTGKVFRSGNIVSSADKTLAEYSPSMSSALTVLSDFISQTDYYTSGEFPAQICFFADGSEYEIICVENGREAIINKAVAKCESPPLRIVILDSDEQLEKLKIGNVAAYCTIEEDGTAKYFKTKGTQA